MAKIGRLLPRAALLATLIPGAGLACEAYDAVVAAVEARERATVERLHAEMRADRACGPELTEWAGVYLARELFRDGVDPAAPVDVRRAALREALALETHWRTLAALGRLEWSDRRYAEAADYLRRVLTEIAEGELDQPPEPDEITALRDLYTDALALGGAQLASSDVGSELFRTQYRGFRVEETPLPITFAYDSTEFDAQGLRYAERLRDHVLTHAPVRIELDGHTDPQGGEAYNYELSIGRARAVRQFLIDGGYEGEIVVRGLGESAVPPPPEGVTEGSDEHFRIARRVTFRSG
jgi:outer membrane protein OmpA-like peptidoglycan-associated protein